MELTKGKLYSNKDETIIYRLVAFIQDSELVYVVNCFSKKTAYINQKVLKTFSEISEQHMLFKVGLKIYSLKLFSKEQKKLVRDRYFLIAPLLADVEKGVLRTQKIRSIANIHGISEKRLNGLLNTYLAYGRIELLIDFNKKINYSLKPRIKFANNNQTYSPGFAFLTRFKLRKGYFLYFLIDSYSKFIYSFALSNKENDYNCIKSLILRCNSKYNLLPCSINSIITCSTWNSFYRNLECVGINIIYSNHSKNQFSFLSHIYRTVNDFMLRKTNEEQALRLIKKEIKLFNEEDTSNESPKSKFFDALPIFKDSFVREPSKIIINLLLKPYKSYYML